MKKHFTLIFTLFLLLLQIPASAQGEWKWANYWSGTGGEPGLLYNYVSKTAFDEDGNVYIWGVMGGQPTFNGSTFLFINNPQVYGLSRRTSLLTKFDSLGNMLWYKVVKSKERECYSHWMEVKDNKVYISGNLSIGDVDHDVSTWLYYFDTLITASQAHAIPEDQRLPPYKPGVYTYFATFDLDGNLLDNHFVNALTREYVGGDIRGEEPLCLPNLGCIPVHVDNEGNTYVFTRLGYNGGESDPYTIQIDGDTNRKYDIYLPGNVNLTQGCLYTGMMYKFSPSWELLYAKPMVEHTEGIATSWALLGDSVNQRYTIWIQGLSFDESDNMYVSGNISLAIGSNHGEGIHQYPIHIYWDSTHYSTMQDWSSIDEMPFLIKYDSDGKVLWNNQIYTVGSPKPGAQNFVGAKWRGSFYADNHIYVVGHGAVKSAASLSFDDQGHYLQPFTDNHFTTAFFVRYNATTGQYTNYGIIPAENAQTAQIPAVSGNRILSFSNKNAIYQWCIDGTFINEISPSSISFEGLRYSSLLIDDNGNLLLGFPTTSSGIIGNGISYGNPTGESSSIFALYHDPEFTTPYVGVPNYGENYSNLKIWPNPTNSLLYIENNNTPIDYITIMDVNGKTLLKEIVGNSNFVVNVNRLPMGTYLLETVCKDQVSINKFVKSNY
ncbi:MAG: T9SS type A sorting domain-containing protein [Bacteroidales bacterium]|nr:T9SS type A sorting domain-containing protein [Bacteroidales bacterium]